MKRIVLLSFSLLFVAIYSNAQINPEVVFTYFGGDCNANCYYQDAIITNLTDKSWPGVGANKTQKTFYYDYHYDEYSIHLISDDISISAMQYSEYYIYNDFQELEYYIYQSEGCGGMVLKFNKCNHQIIEKSKDSILAENYFIKIEKEFNPDSIRAKARDNLSHCMMLFGMPVYEDETDYIRARYKEINSMNNLVERKTQEYIGYYHNDELVKIVANMDSNREYYLDNGKLIFTYYPETISDPAIRVYFYNEDAYKVIEGKENLVKSTREFRDYFMEVESDYEFILKFFK